MFREIVRRPQIADLARLHVVPHQACAESARVGAALLTSPPERFHCHVADCGSLVAASIPVTLHQCMKAGLVGRGDQVLLLGTSARLFASGDGVPCLTGPGTIVGKPSQSRGTRHDRRP